MHLMDQNKNMFNIGVTTLLLWIVTFIFAGCRPGVPKDQVAARVGQAVLTREELKKRMDQEGMRHDQESDFIDRWISRELLYQEAKRLGLQDSEELQRELELIEKEYLVQRLLERRFSETINISEEEIESYYEKNREQFRVDEEEVHLYHILTETREQADKAYQEIRAGESFDQVARERSIGFFRDKGGDMGFVRRDDVIPEVGRQVFRQPEGKEVSPFRSAHGFHILKIGKKRSKGSIKDLADVRLEIVQRLRISKERAVYYDLLAELQKSKSVYVAVPKDKLMQDNK